MMIKRNPIKSANTPAWKDEDGKTLGQVIDKGFPYDNNFDPEERAVLVDPKKQTLGQFVGQLNGQNITMQHIVNLVNDASPPLTVKL